MKRYFLVGCGIGFNNSISVGNIMRMEFEHFPSKKEIVNELQGCIISDKIDITVLSITEVSKEDFDNFYKE